MMFGIPVAFLAALLLRDLSYPSKEKGDEDDWHVTFRKQRRLVMASSPKWVLSSFSYQPLRQWTVKTLYLADTSVTHLCCQFLREPCLGDLWSKLDYFLLLISENK